MSRTIKFHLDENCDPAIASVLRRHGIDVSTTPEAGLIGATDDEQVAHSLPRGRVIFTQDADHLRLHASGEPHAGIAYCHQQARSVGEIIDGLVLIWHVFDADEMVGQVEYL
jgi:predicted nuclease of predicted toxin-antitoxin system